MNLNDFFGIDEEESEVIDDTEHSWKREWVGMPEFVQNKLKPHHTLTVHFVTKQDLFDFAEKLGYSLTERTKSVWYPIHGLNLHIKGAFYDYEE